MSRSEHALPSLLSFAGVDDATTAIAAGSAALALVALVGVVVLAIGMRRTRRAQSAVLGEGSERDLVAHAEALQEAVAELRERASEEDRRLGERIAEAERALTARLAEAERRIDLALAFSSVVRYDAYNELSGQQSSSIALLDSHRTGLVLSSIIHRDQARLYAKRLYEGHSELDLSPEEEQAINDALAREPPR